MFKKILLFAMITAPILWAQDDSASRADRVARLKWEEDQRQDEYANSLARRDWLKDRLIMEVGLGTKYSMMGASDEVNGFGYGAALEYITQWHFAPYVSAGFVFKATDSDFDSLTLAGTSGVRCGLSYYLFPKSPMHLSIMASYGDIYYDHAQASVGGVRSVLKLRGWEGDLGVTYLTNEWYYLNFDAGFYYAGKKMPGTQNNSVTYSSEARADVGLAEGGKGIPNYGLVAGIGIGFALPELFPDDTEKRRRQRESTRETTESTPAPIANYSVGQ